MIQHTYPNWSRAVLLIQESLDDKNFSNIGTAFVITHSNYKFLVTNKHIAVRKNLSVIVNMLDGKMARKSLEELKQFLGTDWFFHSKQEIDIAVMPFGVSPKEDIAIFDPSLFGNFEQILEGEEVFFLGFPLGLTTLDKIRPIVRGGLVASRDYVSKDFIIDGNIFPGSSGSPVFLKPLPFTIEGQKIYQKYREPTLIGIIKENISYNEPAVSVRDGKPLIIFRENAGLGLAHSIDLIKEILESHEFKEKVIKKLDERRDLK